LEKVNWSFRCPPLDFDYAFEVLKNPDHPRFASVCDFIGRRIDARTRERLGPGVSFAEFAELVKATGEIDVVLLLASVLMTTDEIECFWNNGGLALFGRVLQSPGTYNISSAIRFALVLPEAIVGKITNSLPLIASRMDCSNSTTLGSIVQLFARFPADILAEYKEAIRSAIIRSSASQLPRSTKQRSPRSRYFFRSAAQNFRAMSFAPSTP
jgi:hypothetical protein